MDKNLEILQSMFQRYFKSGKVPNRFELKVIAYDAGNHKISIDIKFKANESYCCSEISCHFKPNWNRIKEIACDNNLNLLSPLTIEFNVLVEMVPELK